MSAHRKGYLALTPRSDIAAKGKGVTAPPLGSLDDNGQGLGGGEDVEDWRRFRDAGLLDEAAMERRDRQALADRVSKLQAELVDYQHHMGLLLMEKTQLTEDFGELRTALAEAQELLKREQAAHLIAISEAEKREENLRKAVSFERQCVADLEKALRELQAEDEQKKLECEAKFANAKSLVAGIGDRSLEVNSKLHDAEAKLAEVNRKCAQLDVKMQELGRREALVLVERQSLKIEQDEHRAAFYKQREDLTAWEKKLQGMERKLIEDRRIINEREGKANESDRILRQTERDLQVSESRVESSMSLLKEKEVDINRRLEDLAMKEKKVDSLGIILQQKEDELKALEEKLNVREKVEIQKVLSEQKNVLDEKLLQFEFELAERRKSFDKELRSKAEEVERKEVDVGHKEEKLVKREQAAEMKMERAREKEKDLDARMKMLKEKEKSMKLEEIMREADKKQILTDIESLQKLKDQLDTVKADNAQKVLDMQKVKESLRITEEERSEHLRRQAELKMEIEKCHTRKELLLKEAEELQEERERFEKDWDVLDEKKAAITEDQIKFFEEKESLKKWQRSEEERLKRQTLEIESMKVELEALKLENESLNARMRHEELCLSEQAEDERKKILEEFESMKRELQASIQCQKEEVEREKQTAARELEAQRDAELKKLKELKENSQNELEEARSEKLRMQKEKQNLEWNKKELHDDRHKLREDIDQLVAVSQKLKEQRERFVRERSRFLEFAEKLKSCANCGDLVKEFEFYDVHSPDMRDKEDFVLPRLVAISSKDDQNDMTPMNRISVDDSSAGGAMSWLRKCTLMKILSPTKKIDDHAVTDERTKGSAVAGVEHESSSHVRDLRFDENVKSAGDAHEQSVENSYLSMQREVPEETQQSGLRRGKKKSEKPRRPVIRSRSVNAVVEDARVFLGDDLPQELKQNDAVQLEGDVSNQDSPHTERMARKGREKRLHPESSRMTGSEMQTADSEEPSGSVTVGGGRRKKIKQTAAAAPAVQTPGQTRYNLRRHRPTASAVAIEASSEMNQEGTLGNKKGKGKAVKATASEVNSLPARGHDEDDGIHSHLAQVTTAKTIEEKTVRFTTAATADVIAPAAVEKADLIEEVNDSHEFYDQEVGGGSEAEEEEEDYDEEADHPGEASIGKKIWTFFTT